MSKGDVRRLMIEVGEYIRTKQGYIAKVISQGVYIELDKPVDFKQTSGTHYAGQILFDEGDIEITKHSKNIIDLIAVGDYVNGILINYIPKNEHKIYHDAYDMYDVWAFSNKDIKTILTHEQYEQNCYKIGE